VNTVTPAEWLLLVLLLLVAATVVWLAFRARGLGASLGAELGTRLGAELARQTREDLDRARQGVRDELRQSRDGVRDELRSSRESAAAELRATREESLKAHAELRRELDGKLERVRLVLDERVRELQAANERKLDEMRRTVDEQLQSTLEKRLGESFKLVSDRLDAVHKGLGEMQTLAAGVGDLKRVLTNVKARGTWAEVQLGALLEQVLTTAQFGRNVAVRPGASERVEFAVRLPGPRDVPDAVVWLPIDSKFPQEDWLRLQDAADRADAEAVQGAADALARAVRTAARDIAAKYVAPPHTTDFGIMFLATEGLYAEVLRQPALVDELQRTHRVVVAGPTTLVAILNSLRMGFQTLAIEQRASEVWRVLGAVKTEFGKFGEVLGRVQRQLETASRTIEQTGVRTRALERRLREVEELPEAEVAGVLRLDAGEEPVEPSGP
jgi:DNA recombination protein RmuC